MFLYYYISLYPIETKCNNIDDQIAGKARLFNMIMMGSIIMVSLKFFFISIFTGKLVFLDLPGRIISE